LVKKLEDMDAQRGSSHRFNNIGNLTYISREFNHFETGIGDGFINLDFDSHEPDVLEAHFLWSKEQESKVQNLYAQVSKAFGGEVFRSKEQADKMYEDFCKHRRGLVRQGFERWLDELGSSALGGLNVTDLGALEELSRGESRLESDPPMFVPAKELRADQRVRLFGYEDLVEDELVALVRPLAKKYFFMDEHCMEVKLTDKKHVWLRLDSERIAIFLNGQIEKGLQNEILGILKMKPGDEGVYEKGSGSVESVKMLRLARDRAQDLKEEIERSISENKVPNGGGEDSSFDEKWKKLIGPWAVDALHTFTGKLEAVVRPKFKVSYNKFERPFFALQAGEQVVSVLRPRTSKPTLCENFGKAELKDDKKKQAVERFKTRLLDAGMGSVYGKYDSVEIPLTKALERFEELMGYLGKLSHELSGAKEP
jgi:hypothetical protein